MQKRGDTLTFWFCTEFKGQFIPTVTRTVPSLRQAAPYLTAKNSFLFVQADGGVIEQARLVTEGEAPLSGDVVLNVPPKVVEGQPVSQSIAPAGGTARFAPDASTAPKGLTLAPTGQLAWVPGHDQVGHHEFKVTVTDKGAVSTQTVEIDVVSREDAAAVKGDLAKVDSLYKLPLETEHHPIFAGFGGTSLLLLEGDQLRLLTLTASPSARN